ncbi:hypothetical protein OCU04_007510 [Sclerotinia nivalis]|uniref:Uncharacterized protein n=1 Tax=Sclerotinia nivalis TaxID=352851 RepID=A0A9X0DHF0_9HELO|nr:hypothetical protein OCU04_007510 [Sclerotinia nivalis]
MRRCSRAAKTNSLDRSPSLPIGRTSKKVTRCNTSHKRTPKVLCCEGTLPLSAPTQSADDDVFLSDAPDAPKAPKASTFALPMPIPTTPSAIFTTNNSHLTPTPTKKYHYQ